MSVNKAIIVGYVGKDPETRYTGSGQAVTNFSVATSEKFKNRAGEKQEKTEWHRITAWGKLAEIVQQYVKKGTLVFIEGKIETRQWEDREGVKRYSTGITARELRMLGGRSKDGGASGAPAADDHFEGAHNDNGPGGDPNAIDDSDIPF